MSSDCSCGWWDDREERMRRAMKWKGQGVKKSMRFISLARLKCFPRSSPSSVDSPRADFQCIPTFPGCEGRVHSATHSPAHARALVDCNPPIPFRCPTSCGGYTENAVAWPCMRVQVFVGSQHGHDTAGTHITR